jgi:O-antigen ligase
MASESIPLTRSAGLSGWGLRLEQLIQLVLFVFIASLPFRHLLIIERNGFVVLLVLLALWCVVNKRVWLVRTPIDIPLFSLVLWVGITIPFASFPDYSLKEFGKLLQSVLVFYAVVFFFHSERCQKGLIYLLVAVVALVSAFGLYQFDPANYQAARSFLSSEVWLTTFLVMFIPLCWALATLDHSLNTKAFVMVAGALATGCLLVTQSRAGLVALLIELWVFAWLFRKRVAWIVAGAVTGLLLLGFAIVVYVDRTSTEGPLSELRATVPFRTTTRSVEHRFDIWSFYLSEIARHPVVGIGYGSENPRLRYPHEAESLKPGDLPIRNMGTHNIFLYMALHVGIPGLLLFLWVVAALVRQLVMCYRCAAQFPSNAVLLGAATGTIGLFVRLQFDQMFVGTLAILFWVLTALAVLHFHPQTQESTG